MFFYYLLSDETVLGGWSEKQGLVKIFKHKIGYTLMFSSLRTLKTLKNIPTQLNFQQLLNLNLKLIRFSSSRRRRGRHCSSSLSRRTCPAGLVCPAGRGSSACPSCPQARRRRRSGRRFGRRRWGGRRRRFRIRIMRRPGCFPGIEVSHLN